MIEPITVMIATAVMSGLNLVLMLTVNGTTWWHKLTRWWTKDDYHILKVYRAADQTRFDMITIFIDFFLTNGRGGEARRHLISYDVGGKSYLTITGESYLELKFDLSDERRQQLRLSSPTITWYLYGIGPRGELSHGYEIWAKQPDDVNQILLLFAKMLGHSPLNVSGMFRINDRRVKLTTYRKLAEMNELSLRAFARDTYEITRRLPPMVNPDPAALVADRSRCRHSLFLIGWNHFSVGGIGDPYDLHIRLRGVLDTPRPIEVSRYLASALVIRNLGTFFMMKANELRLEIAVADGGLRDLMRRHAYAIDNFFKTVVKQYAGYPMLPDLIEMVYYQLKMAELVNPATLDEIFLGLNTADTVDRIADTLVPPPPPGGEPPTVAPVV